MIYVQLYVIVTTLSGVGYASVNEHNPLQTSSSSSSYLFPVRTNRNIVYIDNLTKKNRTGGYQRS